MLIARWGRLGARCAAAATVVAVGALSARTRPAAGSLGRQADPVAPAAAGRLYLPRLDRADAAESFEPVPCHAAADACAPSGWTVRCGGIGRVRDLFVVRGPGGSATEAGFAAVLAVGDGAAIGIPAGDGIDWRVATGVDLSGLNHVAAGGDVAAWAVGDGQRIARRAAGPNGCWSIAATGWTTATLLSLEVKRSGGGLDDPWPPGIGGWAVGRGTVGSGPGAREVGVVSQLDTTQAPPLWRNLTVDVDRPLALPPLYDVQAVPGVGGGLGFWAVGQDGATGVVARMQQVEGHWTWRQVEPAVALDGRPSEIVLRSERDGWAFGRGSDGGPDAALWRLEGGLWRTAPTIRHPGQPLLDAYVVDYATVVYGLQPPAAGPAGAEVVRRAAGGGDWQRAARWPADVAAPARDGHRALAPLGAADLLYALGDDLWRVRPGATADLWRRDWRRHDLAAFAGGVDGGWALADVDGVGGLVRVDHAGVRLLRPTTALPRLRALARHGATTWAVGDGGATWRRPDGAPAWRPDTADGTADGDLLALAAAPGGSLWAAGADRAGRGRIWRLRDGRWRPVGSVAVDVSLTSIAVTARGHAWAGGDGEAGGAVVGVRPAPPDGSACPVEPSGERWQPADDLCVLVTSHRGVAVAATGDDTLWLARERDVVEKGIHGNRVHDDLGVRGTGGDCPVQADAEPCRLPPTCRLTAVAAAHPAAVFAAAVCRAPGADPDRGTSRLLAWDGARWRQATVLNTPIDTLAAGTDVEGRPWLWAVGAWSTVVRFAAP